jgi:hypothetical protein
MFHDPTPRETSFFLQFNQPVVLIGQETSRTRWLLFAAGLRGVPRIV